MAYNDAAVVRESNVTHIFVRGQKYDQPVEEDHYDNGLVKKADLLYWYAQG